MTPAVGDRYLLYAFGWISMRMTCHLVFCPVYTFNDFKPHFVGNLGTCQEQCKNIIESERWCWLTSERRFCEYYMFMGGKYLLHGTKPAKRQLWEE